MAGLSSLKKESGYMRNIAEPVAGATAFALALKGVAAATDYLHEKSDKKKFGGVISYAQKVHPELKKVPHDKMMMQMNSFYTLAPRVAVDKELGASMLATTNDYGGTVDLSTAKLVSDIGGRSSGGKQEEVLNFISAGTNASKLGLKKIESGSVSPSIPVST